MWNTFLSLWIANEDPCTPSMHVHLSASALSTQSILYRLLLGSPRKPRRDSGRRYVTKSKHKQLNGQQYIQFCVDTR